MKTLCKESFYLFLVNLFLGLILIGTAFANTNYKLNAPLPANSDIREFDLSQDGKWVLYRYSTFEQGNDKYFDYIGLADGSVAPVEFNSFTIPNQSFLDVNKRMISPDGSRVVFIMGGDNIHSFSTDGSTTAVKLVPPLLASIPGDIVDLLITPNSNQVVFKKQGTFHGIYSVPIDRSTKPVKLTPPMADGGTGVSEFSLGKNGNRVVYLADQDIKGVSELYSVPVDGSEASIKLNTPLESSGEDPLVPSQSSGNVSEDFTISLDGSRVVYRIRQRISSFRSSLYSAPIEGGEEPVKLNASFPFDLQILVVVNI